MFRDFFTNRASEAPQLPFLLQFFLLALLVMCLYATYHNYQKAWFRSCFWWVQFAQVLVLYSWYALMAMPWSESLPFYHCRLAMLVLLFGKNGLFKKYFAYLGLFGSIVAFIYPVFDPFPFPHITFFTFVIGHYALAVNSLTYLLKVSSKALRVRQITIITLLVNGFIGIVNSITEGNYGFLRQTPIINSTHSVLNFYLVTLVCVVAIFFVQEILSHLFKKVDGQLLNE